jgi:hypothetical protein
MCKQKKIHQSNLDFLTVITKVAGTKTWQFRTQEAQCFSVLNQNMLFSIYSTDGPNLRFAVFFFTFQFAIFTRIFADDLLMDGGIDPIQTLLFHLFKHNSIMLDDRTNSNVYTSLFKHNTIAKYIECYWLTGIQRTSSFLSAPGILISQSIPV